MKRNGKELPTLRDGHPRRLADGRNAWRKMNAEQRIEFLHFIREESDYGHAFDHDICIAANCIGAGKAR